MSDFVSIKDYGAVGDGTIDDTSAMKSAILDAESNGKILVIPKGTFKFTQTLIFNNQGICIQGTNVTGSVLLFDPPASETPPVALLFKANYGSVSCFTLKTPRDLASGTTRNEIGIQLYDSDGSQSGSSGIIEFKEICVKQFDINVNIYGNWNRKFTNCDFIDAKTYGIKCSPPESGWSCSGDVFIACNFTGNGWTARTEQGEYLHQGAGMYLDGAYQMNIQNCVFQYNGKALDIRNCPDIKITNCWNEVNYNNSIVRQSARFVGGYDFTNSTVDHLDSKISDIIWFDHINEVVACSGNVILFTQKNGYITQGIQLETTHNLIQNPKLIVDGQPSFQDWSNGGFGSSIAPDATNTYNGANSCYINMTGERYSAAWTASVTVVPGDTYTISVASFYDGSIGDRDGFGVCLEYRPVCNKSEMISILPSAINAWETHTASFVIPDGIIDIAVFFVAPNGGKFWFADPIFVHHNTYVRDDVKLEYGSLGTTKYIKAKNSDGSTIGYLKVFDSPSEIV